MLTKQWGTHGTHFMQGSHFFLYNMKCHKNVLFYKS